MNVMKKVILSIFFAMTITFNVFSAIIGGEIMVENIYDNVIKATITVRHTYNNLGDSIEVDFGDGTSSLVSRIDFISYSSYYLSVYQVFHTYPIYGVYKLSTEFYNWPYGIANIPNSVMVPFGLSSIVKVNNLNNSAPIFQNELLTDTAIVGLTYNYNPLANDSEGDSIVYRLIDCLGEHCNEIPGYIIPSGLSINSLTGIITWDSPQGPGMWAIAYEIEEWKNNVKISVLMRQMTITVINQSSINHNELLTKKYLFPNPTSGFLNINLKDVRTIIVLNEVGNVTATFENVNEINLNNFEKGLYIIRVFTENNMLEEKIVLEK